MNAFHALSRSSMATKLPTALLSNTELSVEDNLRVQLVMLRTVAAVPNGDIHRLLADMKQEPSELAQSLNA